MPFIPDNRLDDLRTVLHTASDCVERLTAYGWDPDEAHAEFRKAHRALIDYLRQEGRL